MRKPKNIVSKSIPSFAVVVDGDTEVWYLNMLKRNERNIRVSIKPEIPNGKSIRQQYDLVRELSGKEFTKVFWIVDLDTIIKEENEAQKGRKSPIKIFQEYRNKLVKDFKNVVVIVNNPCLEFWFLLHFEATSKYFEKCAGAETQLKKHLTAYEKKERFFTKQDDDIYLKLQPHLQTAIKNAIALGNFSNDAPQRAMCEMELFFLSEELRLYFQQ
ncbi:RloB-like protein [Flexibacter flexilis DSM 6793]|uniref:RloB-like protein n=1 Tax=Flexibacter flexilis DSM 6793 TaxID=927664 RepID=A0A1I1I4P0_9BACT|nr:RloB family protein [Flexibacter flexilis]SFC31051.1 RloB-like protein [Flexibacter flexilis DSM 6793]